MFFYQTKVRDLSFMSQSVFFLLQSNNNILRNSDALSWLYKSLIFLFLISTLFDPADKLLGLKLPLFLACWAVGGLIVLMRNSMVRIPINLLAYVFLMVLIPLLSITYYFITDGSEPFEGFLLLKSYLFLSFTILLFITRVDVLKYLSVALTLLAFSVLALSIFVLIYPEGFLQIYHFGEKYGIYSIDKGRDYGSGQTFFQMYFVTSSMLVVSIAYYFDKWRSLKSKRWIYLILIVMNVCAMIVAGTRNNMIMAIALPIGLVVLYSKRKVMISALVTVFVGLSVIVLRKELLAIFDPNEQSNHTKLTTLYDYFRIFSDYKTLLFGRGLGAYDYWTNRGLNFVTELTYFEVIRNFGLFMGGVMLILMLYPIIYAFILRRSYQGKSIILAYAAYLVMSITNPLFFSSMGMLILAIIIANIYIYESDFKRHRSSGNIK